MHFHKLFKPVFFSLFSFHAQHCSAGEQEQEQEPEERNVAGADSGKYARKNNNKKHGQQQQQQQLDEYYQAHNDVENELTQHEPKGAGYAALLPLPLSLPDSNVARVINNGDEDNSASASSSLSLSSELQPDIIPYPLSVGETSWKAEKQRRQRQREQETRWGRIST